MAPELVHSMESNGCYTVKPALDVWAFGQLLLTLWNPRDVHGHHADKQVLRDLYASKGSLCKQVGELCSFQLAMCCV